MEEYERKVRKRRARLITATEESFTHIRRMRESSAGAVFSPLAFNQINFGHFSASGSRKQPLSPYEAAQAVFPSLSRSLQKYLRVTRQQPRHTMESILHHLSTCLSYDMSPRAFLEKYIVTSPVLQVPDLLIIVINYDFYYCHHRHGHSGVSLQLEHWDGLKICTRDFTFQCN